MATEYVFLQGKVKWVRAHQPNEWQKWAMVLYPNAESLEKIRELQAEGLKNVIKKDEDGYHVSFSRPTSVLIRGKISGTTPQRSLTITINQSETCWLVTDQMELLSLKSTSTRLLVEERLRQPDGCLSEWITLSHMN